MLTALPLNPMTLSVSASFEREFTFVWRYQAAFSIGRFIEKHLRTWLNKFVRKLINHIDDSLLVLNGALPIVKAYDSKTASVEIKSVSNILNQFIKLESSLAKIDYFGSQELKEKINACISCLYDIDLALRRAAYPVSPVKSNSDFISALADSSKAAITSSLAN